MQRQNLRMQAAKLSATIFLTLALCLVTAIASPAQTYTTLFSFNIDQGYGPSSLVQGANGNFYGTTGFDGVYGSGTVFEISSRGEYKTLYSFCSQPNCPDGEYPPAALAKASNGHFYGVTQEGGANGSGTAFEITPSGNLTTLYSFCAEPHCADGGLPKGGLVQDRNGNFYGTTTQGGTNGLGTVFEMSPTGQLRVLYSVCSVANCADGFSPVAALIQATNGEFYGIMSHGGAQGVGTVFELTPTGSLRTLYSLCSLPACSDGEYPSASLVQATSGMLYGTVTSGGSHGSGTIFEITPGGKFKRLYSFCAQASCADGSYPYAALLQGTDGNLYGTTVRGGSYGVYGEGTLFKFTPPSTLTTLYNYCDPSCNAAGSPYSAMIQATNGLLYGTTGEGEEDSAGTIFSLSLAP
jgi:uncharacterized repeat protein (TIGR03803 family)